jgi:hypothetical protein
MKKIIQLIALFAILVISGCKKTENKIYFQGGNIPSFSSNITDSVFLIKDKEADNVVTFRWTNPEYRLSSGISSHDVDYTIEFDTVGGNFKSKNKFQKTIDKDLFYTFTIKELNNIFETQMNLLTDRYYDIQVRLVANLNNSVPIPSKEVISFKTKPYPSKEFWLVGGASEGGWNNPLPDPYVKNQKFSPISPTKFELVTNLKANQGYLVLPVMGSWDQKYCLDDNVDPATVTTGGDFVFKKSGGKDFLSPSSEGVYKLTFDFQSFKFKVEKQ